MSDEPPFMLGNVVHGFKAELFSYDLRDVLQDLWPLKLSSDALLDKDIAGELVNCVEQLAEAVKHDILTLQYIKRGMCLIEDLLETWHDHDVSSLGKLQLIKMILQFWTLAYSTTLDPSAGYAGLANRLEKLYNLITEKYEGSTVMTRKHTDICGEKIVKDDTIQNLGTTIISRLQQIENRWLTFADCIHQVYHMLHVFVQDESISLAQPLASIPVWATNPVEDWMSLLWDIFKMDLKMRNLPLLYQTLFKWGQMDHLTALDADTKLRLPGIIMADIKLWVPQDDIESFEQQYHSEFSGTDIPSTILELSIQPSTVYSLKLESVERIAVGVSIMQLVFHIDGIVDPSLESVIIECGGFHDARHPLSVVDHSPKRFGDVVIDPHHKPRDSRASIKVRTYSLQAKWTFSRPRYRRLISTFPTDFGISLKLEYEHQARFAISMALVCRRPGFWGSRQSKDSSPNNSVIIDIPPGPKMFEES